jgi:hypothetical protein
MSFDISKWSDVVPVSQDDGPHPVAAIAYKPECKLLFDRLIIYGRFIRAVPQLSP